MNRLYRSRRLRIIGGVAGGLAEYFQIDVVLIRLLWLVAAFVGGGGVLAYIIAWIVIPEERISFSGERDEMSRSTQYQYYEEEIVKGAAGSPFAEETQGSFQRRRHAGLLLIGLGIIFLAYQIVGPLFHYFWPLLIIGAGIFLLSRDWRGAGK